MPSAAQALVIKPVSQLAQFAQRLFTPPKDDIRGIEQDTWYSPLQPVKPMGPVTGEPKGFQFYAGQNLIWTPRPDAEYNAFELKGLATYPLARICIENVKDSVCRVPFTCQLKAQPGESKKQTAERARGNEQLLMMNRFFEKPDRENCWDDWLRPLLEDMLVIDAGTALIRKTVSGQVAELRVLPGEMITRYIDENGYTPIPPNPAYTQIWWGVPLLNLTTEQLVYRPRNIVRRGTVSSQLYGMSPTEQLAQEIVPGMKRLEFVTAYYTAGSIPDVVQVIPKGVDPDQIAEAMQWMNSDLAGNLQARRQWRMVQGFAAEGKEDQILFPKEKLLADQYDELHIRKVCFGYGTSPQRLMRMMGSRNAQSQQEAAELEGLIPWLDWVKNYRNHITQRVFGFTEIETTYDAEREPDPEKQAGRLKVLVGSAIISPNAAREEIGEEPDDTPEADMLGIITASGFVPLGAEDKLAQQQTLGTDAETVHQRGMERADNAAKNRPQPPGGGGGTPSKPTSAVGKPSGKANGHAGAEHGRLGFAAVLDARPASGEDQRQPELLVGHAVVVGPVSKTAHARIIRAVINPSAYTPQAQLALRRFHLVMHNSLKEMEVKAVRELKKELRKKKARKLWKADETEKTADKIMQELMAEFNLLPDEVEDLLTQAGMGGASLGAIQISLTDRGMLDKVNQTAAEWARRRAAELVGMRRTAEGELIENPNAQWAITDSTRDKLMIVIRDLFAEQAPTLKDVEQRVMDAGIFSDTRASMIARTEISRAQTQGNLESWKVSGKVATVAWELSGNHDRDDECDEYADGGPYALDDAPDCPAHPNCDCVLVLDSFTEGEE